MSTDNDFDRLADAWIAEGPFDLADPVLQRALDDVHRTRQRRPLGRPWRITAMPNRMPMALALVAIVAIAGVAIAGLSRQAPGVGTTEPGVSPVPAPSLAAPSAAAPASSSSDVPMGFDGTGTIAFTRVDAGGDGSSRTWLVDPAGTNEKPFRVLAGFSGNTDLPGTGCCIVFAPDGRMMAVGFDETGRGAGRGFLKGTAITALDETGAGVLAGYASVLEQVPICGACEFPDGLNYVPVAWSAQGDLLALQAWNDADHTKDGIYTEDESTPGGSSFTWTGPITSGRKDMALQFSPDGGRLLFVRPVDGGSDNAGGLYVVDVASGKETPLTAPGVTVFVSDYYGPGATWSPDGTQVAYAATDASGSTGSMRAWVVPATGGDAVPVSPEAAFITSAHWSPDGRLIAYDAPGLGSGHDLFVVAPDGTGARNLTAAFGPGVCCARWSPDSKALLTAGTLGPTESSLLYIVPADGGEIRRVTAVEGMYEDYSWGAASR
jgi:hypothetical protein